MKSRRAKTAFTEEAAIALLRARFGTAPGGSVELAVGDDAAVLSRGAGKLVWSIDTSAEGTHFELGWLSLGLAAGRAFRAALSDLSAMGARPLAALCALTLAEGAGRREVAEIAREQARVARSSGCPLIGGDVTSGAAYRFTTSVLGSAHRPLRRDGARAGDEVWLIGDVGDAAAGLRFLQRDGARVLRTGSVAAKRCVGRWQTPPLLLAQGQVLVGRAHASIDVSDGLASEARHLARASSVSVRLVEERLREAASRALNRASQELRVDPLELMLTGGEDYALLATGPAARRPEGARVIGLVVRGRGAWLVGTAGVRPLLGGFDHLRRA